MIVSNRQRRLLELLLRRQEEVTAGEMAEELRISARTVHRDMQELEPMLAANGLSLVRKSGIGISLQGGEEELARFKEQLGASVSATYSPDERKALILCRLLREEEPVKLFALAHMLHAAIPTVTRDLDELEPQLNRQGLELVRRRGYGVELAGGEENKRGLIAALAHLYLDDSELFGASSDDARTGPVAKELLRMVGKDVFHAVEQLLWKLEEAWPRRLSETAYTRLLVRLSVALTRQRQQRFIEGGASAGASSPALDRFLEAFGPDWPEAERDYVQRLLDEAKAEAESGGGAALLSRYGPAVAESAAKLIRAVAKRWDVPFDRDRSLLDGLIRHLGPALERLRALETIRNPLLPQIKKDYGALFEAVRAGAGEALVPYRVPEEEIGYLTMHFGAAAERWRLFPRTVRAMLVCTSGIGSSKLLAVRIHKEFPQVDLIGHYSWYEAARISPDRYDLIVSTVDLPMQPDRYVKLSPLLTREETERLREAIWRAATAPDAHASSARADATPPAARKQEEGAVHAGEHKEKDPLQRLKRVHAYTAEMLQLLDRFVAYPLDLGKRGRDLEAVLSAMLDRVALQGGVQNPEAIVRRLIEREHSGSQLIAGTPAALFHTRSEWVPKPLLALFRLATPLPLGSGEARQILLMLAPPELNRPALEVLSEISAMLLQPEMIRLLQEGGAEEIKSFISQELEEFMRQQEEWGEPT
ncbi:BglG family transcription antiterminator [Cohnella zeiphila]|uniref:BglG family transcription antiterminator n=1 Tax=Cohnella zeiphila TaxID=2761120 RepID=A0A7X0SK15_9BACL|nr:BglG family transcription antiterminator [Cohnella zeiphila]MBB6731389.1 BglG family transcription antiterminator [Cohnella zeiphila]